MAVTYVLHDGSSTKEWNLRQTLFMSVHGYDVTGIFSPLYDFATDRNNVLAYVLNCVNFTSADTKAGGMN